MNPLLNTFEMIDDQTAAVLRQKTDLQRLRSVDAFWNFARAVLKAAIRTEHPDWAPERVQIEIARRISTGALDHIAISGCATAMDTIRRCHLWQNRSPRWPNLRVNRISVLC